MVIQSWRTKEAEAVFFGRAPKGFPAALISVARRKLATLDAAAQVEDLRVPPGNRLEQLKGDRAGQWSIRVNNQFRICFVWGANGPEEVEFIDYH
jgi:proteic killer suppression protein